MALTSHISNAAISSNPATGLVVGDVDPSVTQLGTITLFRNADDENNTDLGAAKTDFDPHDHGAAGGGQPIGTGPVVAIATNGIDNAALSSSPAAITSAKVQAGAVTTVKIADATVEKAQLGAPVSRSKSASGAASTSFTFAGVSILPLYSVEVDPGDGVVAVAPYTIVSNSASNIAVGTSTGGLSVSVTCRAYGCTGIS